MPRAGCRGGERPDPSNVSISVVIPVLNGAQYLDEVLRAVADQTVSEEVEVLVIDSGSTDGSLEIARRAGVRLIEIPQQDFQHGRTRNLGVSQTEGHLIAFLTQDATPASDTWLESYRLVFASDERIAAAYGPHRPRAETNPLMARLLTEFFSEMSPDGSVVVHTGNDTEFLSNSNSCIRRSAWEQIPFRELPYAEDRALGRDLLDSGWAKAYVPAAAVLHAHNYGLVESSRRWFDEYRGLRDSIGEKHEASPTGALRILARSVEADRRWLRTDSRYGFFGRMLWTTRSIAYHCCRIIFGGLGSRADRIPEWMRSRLSLEGRADGIGHK